MERKFDAVVIGTGVAGATAALEASAAGCDVAVIDSGPFGGTCPLRGCDPKKILFGAAEAVDRAHDMDGISKDTHLDWPALVAFKNRITRPFSQNLQKNFAGAGVQTYQGRARFVGKTTVQVGADILIGKHVVIANGAKPRRLNIPGEQFITTSDRFMDLEALPRSITFAGGGYISFEFAHVAASAGCQVRILHKDERLLRPFDQDMVKMLVQASEERAISFQLGAPLVGVERVPNGRLVAVAGNGEKYETDMVVHGAGRVADVDDLDTARAGVQTGRHGVEVNGYMQSVSNPNVWAAGDACSRIQLTPVAILQGQIVARNIVQGSPREKFDYTVVPSAVFTVPILASVGLKEEDAKQQGLNYDINMADTSSWYTARRIGLKHTGFKVLIEKDTSRIIGAHLLGPSVEEAINIFAMAMKFGLTAKQIKNMPWAYPSSTFDINFML